MLNLKWDTFIILRRGAERLQGSKLVDDYKKKKKKNMFSGHNKSATNMNPQFLWQHECMNGERGQEPQDLGEDMLAIYTYWERESEFSLNVCCCISWLGSWVWTLTQGHFGEHMLPWHSFFYF